MKVLLVLFFVFGLAATVAQKIRGAAKEAVENPAETVSLVKATDFSSIKRAVSLAFN